MSDDPRPPDSGHDDSRHDDSPPADFRLETSQASDGHVDDERLFAPELVGRDVYQPKRQRQSTIVEHSRWLPAMVLVLITLLILLLLPPFLERISYHIARGQHNASRDQLRELTPTAFSNTSRQVAAVAEKSVVYINTLGPVEEETNPYSPDTSGQGSGVIVDGEGYVLTNFHVVVGARRIIIHLPSGQKKLADVVGVDEYTDLALLKVETVGLPAAKWGDSSGLEQGDPVWAIGSPFGLDNSVTFGIISAKSRDGIGDQSAWYQDLLQTDVAVNPGNSGGALVNAQGDLVGINTAIVGTAYRGISFAIPSNMAKEVVDRLKRDGEVPRGWLGVRLDRVVPEKAREAGIEEGQGAVVYDILDDSPAEAAGLLKNDIIIRWDGKAIDSPRRLSFVVAQTAPDAKVQVDVIRDNQQMSIDIKVGRLSARSR